MAAALLLALGLALLDVQGASGAAGTITTAVNDVGTKVHISCVMNHSDISVTGHEWLKDGKVLATDQLPDLHTEYQVDKKNSTGKYSCVFLPEPLGRAEISVKGPPVIKATRKSEHASEGESVKLSCTSNSIDTWVWYRVADSKEQVLTNSSENKYYVSSSESKSELHIRNLDMTSDPGTYICNGTNSEGTSQDVITLRVRSHLAALWPFLGIMAEVLVLLTIILIYEKRRKPDEPLDDDDAGAAPLKGNAPHVNDKGKKVRQRNAS